MAEKPLDVETAGDDEGQCQGRCAATGSAAVPAPPAIMCPRIIWILWFQGWEEAPEVQKRCRESWEIYNPGWEVRAICRDEFPSLLGDLFPEYLRLREGMNCLAKFGGYFIPPPADSDLVRTLLLARYGGVWADATMLCRRRLDDWLPEAIDSSGFFVFTPEDKDDIVPLMSSFIACTAAHSAISALLPRLRKYWSTPWNARDDLGYFSWHKLLATVVGHEWVSDLALQYPPDPCAKRAWGLMPRVTGEYGVEGPHFWVKYSDKLAPPPTPELRRVIDEDRTTPMWKLTHHEAKLDDLSKHSCYWVLLEVSRRNALAEMRSPTP